MRLIPPHDYDDLGLFWIILWTFFVNFTMTPPKNKENALTSLEISVFISTPLKILKMVWSPPKNGEYGQFPPPLKNEGPPLRMF